MTRRPRDPLAPPRLLLGVALLYWGGVTGFPLVGLAAAFLVEGRGWIPWRWQFGERGFVRAWSLSVATAILSLAALWLGGESVPTVFVFLRWMPLFFLPIILAQQYAVEPRLPLNTFSIIARRKMQSDRAAGRRVEPVMIHFGYIYYCLVLLGSAFRGVSDIVFFVGLVILVALGLFCASPVSRQRPWSWSVAVALTGGLGLSVATGLVVAYQALGGLYQVGSGLEESGDQIRTAIGHLGRLKQSYRIRWRVREEEPAGMRLFRTAAYNRYGSGHWTHRPMYHDHPRADYDDMESLTREGEGTEYAFRPEEFTADPASRRKLSIRGAVSTVVRLPHPESIQRLTGIEVGGAQYNSLGTLRLWNPDHGVIDAEIYYGGANHSEMPPDLEWDLQIPAAEREGMQRVCAAWGLYDLPDREAATRIRGRFLQDFEYTLHLGAGTDTGPRYSRALTTFLEGGTDPFGNPTGRRGHCEYFASSAVMLFRELGIPARYCVGYAAREQDHGSGEWILRGRHAHAWCRVYLGGGSSVQSVTDPETGERSERVVWTGGKWMDFDPTPPSWFAVEGSAIPWERRILDWWQQRRENFLVWRMASGSRGLLNGILMAVGGCLVGFVAWRLARSRTRGAVRRSRGGEPVSGPGVARTPLQELAAGAEHWLGPRPEAQPFTRWILPLAELVPGCGTSLRRAVSYHWKARFDPIGLDPAEDREFRTLCAELKARLKHLRRSEG